MTTITVTAEHIARGLRDSCELCPIALAIRDAIPHVGVFYVDSAHVTFGPSGNWVDVELPSDVSRFIEAFDGGYDDGTVRPFTFELDYPAVTT